MQSMKRQINNRTLVVLTALVIVWPLVTNAGAQSFPEHGGRVFGLVGGSFGEGGSAPLAAAGAGLRLTRNLGLDLELVHIHDLDFSDADFIIQRGVPEILIFPPFNFTHEGNVTAFMTKLTVEFPVAGDRLIPFLTGGGGVGRIAERIGFRCSGACPAILLPEVEQAETGLSLTVGGGVDVRLWQGLAVGGEVRWLRLLAGQRDLDVAHVTGRVSYRF